MFQKLSIIFGWLVSVILGYFLLLPFSVFCLLLNEVVRFILRATLACFGSNLELMRSGLDGFFRPDVGIQGGVILGVIASQDVQELNLDRERALFNERVLQKPGPDGFHGRMFDKLEKVFTTKWGYGCWKKVPFQIHNHVRVWTNFKPRNGLFHTKPEFFQEIIPTLTENFTNLSVPLWEWVIIPNVQFDEPGSEPGISTIRVFRVHHSYMDGISMGLMLTECLLDFGSDRSPFILDPKAKLSFSAEMKLLSCKAIGLLLLPCLAVKVLLSKNYSIQEDPFYPGPVPGNKQYGVSDKIKFNAVKKRRASYTKCGAVSTSNILASITVNALEQFLSENNRKLSEHSMLRMRSAVCPFPRPHSRPTNQAMVTVLNYPLSGSKAFKLVDLNPKQKDFATWALLVLIARCPLTVFSIFSKIAGTKFPISSIFTNTPLTRVKGSGICGGGLVSDIGGWPTAFDWVGLYVIATTMGGETRFWCMVDDSVMSRREMNRFLELLTLIGNGHAEVNLPREAGIECH